jgi:glycosyltransferase 2 family protein
MDQNRTKLLENFSTRRILIPVAIGLGVVGYMLYRDPASRNLGALLDAKIHWLLITVLVLLVRDVGYMYRIRHITEKALSWRQSVDVIMLWEFASCVMPSVVGGSTVATFIINKEGIPLGKSLAYVMVTAMLDNLYFVVAAPIVVLLTQGKVFPDVAGLSFSVSSSLEVAFIISYGLIGLYAFLMVYALFFKPQAVKRLLLRITSMPFLRRWRQSAFKHGNELVLSSYQIKGKSWRYWGRAALSTAFVWTARYFVVSCIIAAFLHLTLNEHLLIFARNFVWKVVLLVAVTPGGAGIVEGTFNVFFQDFITPSLLVMILLFYRIVTYYLYLVLGSVFLPRWMARVFGARKEHIREEVPIH